MIEEKEVEYKSLVSEGRLKELEEIISTFAEKKKPYQQINTYFDDERGTLDLLGVTLRIREKKDVFEIQVKIPQTEENKNLNFSEHRELRQTIQKEEADAFFNFGLSAENAEIIKRMNQVLGLSDENHYQPLGRLITDRTDFQFYTDTISLDKNSYNGIEDYEIEWETQQHKFVSYINENLQLKFGNGKGKKKRFMDSQK